MRFFGGIGSLAALLWCLPAAAEGTAWPATTPERIGQLSEASGVVWHPGRGAWLAVNDEGWLEEYSADRDGRWRTVGRWGGGELGDLEGIAYKDPFAAYEVYLLVERPAAILRYSLRGEGEILNRWDLEDSDLFDDLGNQGPEALAYIHNRLLPLGRRSPTEGYFLVGVQRTGRVHPVALHTDHSFTVGAWHLHPDGLRDVAGLDVDAQRGHIYVAYDSPGQLYVLNPNGQIRHRMELPGAEREGIALWAEEGVGYGLAIAFDSGGRYADSIHLWSSSEDPAGSDPDNDNGSDGTDDDGTDDDDSDGTNGGGGGCFKGNQPIWGLGLFGLVFTLGRRRSCQA